MHQLTLPASPLGSLPNNRLGSPAVFPAWVPAFSITTEGQHGTPIRVGPVGPAPGVFLWAERVSVHA